MNTNTLKNKIKFLLNQNIKFPKKINEGVDQRGYASYFEFEAKKLILENIKGSKDPISARSIEDVSVDNVFIDIKTTDIDKKFKMPNMISIDKLKKNYFTKEIVYVFIIYSTQQKKIIDISLYNIWQLNWNDLHIQNLGKGQLQIKNMQTFIENSTQSDLTKEEWYDVLIENGSTYYKNLMKKVEKFSESWNV